MPTPSADSLYRRALSLMPAWNDQGPDLEARHEGAQVLLREAALAGHPGAVELLATGGASATERLHWCKVLAQSGDDGPLISHLTDGDEGALGLEVLQAARAGEAWAATAVSDVYGLGMVDARTGVELATVEGTYGWLPAVAAPKVEARRWLQRAVDVGFGPAHLRLVLRFDDVPREEAVRHLRTALAWEALQPALRVVAEERLACLLDDLGEPFGARLAERERQAAAGNIAATNWLAEQSLRGEDVPRDAARARALYERAAKAGSVDALRELGRMFEEGLAGPVDLDAARAAYEQAAELGGDTFSRTRLAERFGLDWYALGPDEQG